MRSVTRAPLSEDLEACLMEYRGAVHAEVLLGVKQRKGNLDLLPLKEAVKAKNA